MTDITAIKALLRDRAAQVAEYVMPRGKVQGSAAVVEGAA